MSSGRHGLGLGNNPAKSVAPAPAVIEQYFVNQMHYFQQNRGEIHNLSRYTTYVKNLNQPDVPMFTQLKGVNCISRIVVDMWNGCIKDAWFELRTSKANLNGAYMPGIEKFKDVKINSFDQLADFEDPELGYPPIVWLFKWHLNIVHMSREYLKGGWLERPARIKAIEVAKQARKFLNKFGTKNIINNAKPDPLERSWYTEKNRPLSEAERNGYVDAEQMIEMAENIQLIPKEEAIAFLDGLLEKEDK